MEMKLLPALYFKASDVQNFKTLKESEVSKAVLNVIDEVLGCQRIRGLWEIYTKSQDERLKLLINGITLRNQSVGLYKNNPFRAGLQSPDEEVIKLTFQDVPLSKGNRGIETFIKDNNLEKTSEIQYGKIRDSETKELTEILNGARIVYVKPFPNHLPRDITIAGVSAKLYYHGQVTPTRPMLCTQCFKTDHTKSKCTSDKLCIKCKKPDHSVNNTTCDAEAKQPHKSVTAFQGSNDVLSNFYPCDINIHGILAKSAEHAYQYTKCIRRGKLDIAKKVMNAENALAAKKLSRELPYDSKWNDQKAEVMYDIIVEKTKQVPEFKEELLSSKRTIVEAVRGDFYWSSGLNKTDTLNTKLKYWPGENKMGSILMKIKTDILNAEQSNYTQQTRQKTSNSQKEATQYDKEESSDNGGE